MVRASTSRLRPPAVRGFFDFERNGKETMLGLGPLRDISLAKTRASERNVFASSY